MPTIEIETLQDSIAASTQEKDERIAALERQVQALKDYIRNRWGVDVEDQNSDFEQVMTSLEIEEESKRQAIFDEIERLKKAFPLDHDPLFGYGRTMEESEHA